MLPKSWLFVHQCQIEIWRQSYGGERVALLFLPGKRETQLASASRIVSPSQEQRELLYPHEDLAFLFFSGAKFQNDQS